MWRNFAKFCVGTFCCTLCYWVNEMILFSQKIYLFEHLLRARTVKVLLGSVNRTSMPVQRDAIQIKMMSSYNPSILRDDISLIKLGVPVSFSSNVKPIQLPSKSQASKTYLSSVLIVSGFGLTTSNKVSSTLQYTDVIGISNSECRSVFGSLVSSAILCTRGFPNRNQGSCQVNELFPSRIM